jgi:plastocyanin
MKREIFVLLSLLTIFLVACGAGEDAMVESDSGDGVMEGDAMGEDSIDVPAEGAGVDEMVVEDDASTDDAIGETDDLTASGTTHTIKVDDGGFVPDTLSIAVGDTVVWENVRDSTGSTRDAFIVGVRSCFSVRSPQFGPGDSWQHTFDEAIECNYIDGIRTTQTGKVMVE